MAFPWGLTSLALLPRSYLVPISLTTALWTSYRPLVLQLSWLQLEHGHKKPVQEPPWSPFVPCVSHNWLPPCVVTASSAVLASSGRAVVRADLLVLDVQSEVRIVTNRNLLDLLLVIVARDSKIYHATSVGELEEPVMRSLLANKGRTIRHFSREIAQDVLGY